MKCPQCGKSSNVTISGKTYCTSCGAVVKESPVPAAAQKPASETIVNASGQTPAADNPPSVPPANTSTMQQPAAPSSAAPRRMDISAPTSPAPAAIQAPPAPADRPVVTPITPTRTMQDVMRPAAAYHNQVTSSDDQTVASPASDPQPATPDLKPVTEHTTAPAPEPVPTAPDPAPILDAAPVSIPAGRLAAAQAVPKSDSIIKFHDPLPAAATPVPPIAASELASTAQQPISPAAAPIVAAPAPAPEPQPEPVVAAELPAPAVTQHEAMQNLVSPAIDSKEEAFKLAMAAATANAAKPNPMAVGAAALAVVVMGGYIWLQNYPRMQLSAVAGRAGFTATLPGYLPSSYKLNGGPQAQPGQVALNYTAPGLPEITIRQQMTSWDASSLADNYVAVQDPSFSSIRGQGLTIYLYGNGQASWVNHGIWYNITGASRLSRGELLKLAYSL